MLRVFLMDLARAGLILALAMPWNSQPQIGPGLCLADMECCEIFRDC